MAMPFSAGMDLGLRYLQKGIGSENNFASA